MDIDTGLRDKMGRPVYLVHLFYRDIRDIIAWIIDTPATALNKMDPLLKTSAEALINVQFWNKKPVTEKEGFAGALERWAHIAIGTSPWRSVSGIIEGETEGVIKPPLERWIGGLGGWTRHGLVYPAQVYSLMANRDKTMFLMSLTTKEREELQNKLNKGLIDGTMAHKFMKFRQSRNLAKKELMKEVNHLFQENRVREAVAKMQAYGISTASIYNRLAEHVQRSGAQ
jgi:hypothetical protein